MVAANRVDMGGELNVGFGELPAGVDARSAAAGGRLQPRADVCCGPRPMRRWRDAHDGDRGACRQVAAVLNRFKQQTWLVRGSNNVPVWSHFADRAAVAVVQPAPFTISIVEPKAPLVQSGTKELKVVAEKRDGFDGRIAVRMLYDPPGLSSHQGIGIEPGKTEAVIPLTTAGNASVPRLEDHRRRRGRRERAGADFVGVRHAAARAAVPGDDVSAGGDRAGEVARLRGRDRRISTPFEGAAKVELVGLPPGVTTTPQEITKDSTEVMFPLVVAADARVGPSQAAVLPGDDHRKRRAGDAHDRHGRVADRRAVAGESDGPRRPPRRENRHEAVLCEMRVLRWRIASALARCRRSCRPRPRRRPKAKHRRRPSRRWMSRASPSIRSEVVLDHGDDYQGVIAVATRADGVTLDVTDQVTWDVDGRRAAGRANAAAGRRMARRC